MHAEIFWCINFVAARFLRYLCSNNFYWHNKRSRIQVKPGATHVKVLPDFQNIFAPLVFFSATGLCNSRRLLLTSINILILCFRASTIFLKPHMDPSKPGNFSLQQERRGFADPLFKKTSKTTIGICIAEFSCSCQL
jgi:hypothetical protein